MIKKYSLIPLQTAMNYALSLDEKTPAKLVALEGKVIEIIIEPLGIHFFITVQNRQIVLLDKYAGKPETVITSSPLGLIRLSFLPASKARSLFNDKIKLSGNIEPGLQIKKLIDELDIDWETHIARFTGDMVAHQLGSIFRQGQALKNKLKASFQQNTRDYLQDEVRLIPSREEMEDFFQEIDGLNLAVERLQAKMTLVIYPNDTN